MNRILLGSSMGAVVLAAVFWFFPGVHSGRLQTELRDAQTQVSRLGQQLEELRVRNAQAEAALAVERTRLQTTDEDLRREKEMNGRLHLLVSEGKK